MGYGYALAGKWQPTEAELRLADPQILATMHDLDQIPKELIPERVARAMKVLLHMDFDRVQVVRRQL
jgi:hypothetical protein